jgi:hypothetical protein
MFPEQGGHGAKAAFLFVFGGFFFVYGVFAPSVKIEQYMLMGGVIMLLALLIYVRNRY